MDILFQGTEAVLGICFNTSEINGPLFLDENPFQGMYNLRFLKVYMERSRKSGEGRLYLPQGLVYLPRKLRILYWDECPLKCLPSNFKAEFLVKLSMINSKLEKLWEATQVLEQNLVSFLHFILHLEKELIYFRTKLRYCPFHVFVFSRFEVSRR